MVGMTSKVELWHSCAWVYSLSTNHTHTTEYHQVSHTHVHSILDVAIETQWKHPCVMLPLALPCYNCINRPVSRCEEIDQSYGCEMRSLFIYIF